MSRLIAISIFLCVTPMVADEPNSLKLAAPEGWGGESIQLPPGFAPDMKLKGVEHIRFAPGMMQPNSDSFFCYAFVFELDRTPALSETVIKDEILKYYRGLCKAVLRGATPELDPAKFEFDMMKVDPSSEKSSASRADHIGKLVWVEPFATRKTQTLHMEIRTWSKDDQNVMFVAVSPQDRDAKIWTQLRTIRNDYENK